MADPFKKQYNKEYYERLKRDPVRYKRYTDYYKSKYSRLKEDPDAYRRHNEHIAVVAKNRYRNDEEYREVVKKRSREYYRRKHPDSRKFV